VYVDYYLQYLVTCQRAIGHQAQDIGMWENILKVISLLAVLTNAGIIAFHSTFMKEQFVKYIDGTDDPEDPDYKHQLLIYAYI
jgi:hypothetical protein